MDVVIVELHSKKSRRKGLDSKDLSGSFADVSLRLDAMMKNGRLAGLKRFQLAAVEGKQVSISVGENKPYVMGAAVTGRGNVSTQISYRSVGTQVRVSPYVMGDGSISLDLNIQDSRGQDSTTASVGKDEKGAAIPAVDFIQTSFTGKISVPSGQTVVVNDVKTISKEGRGETLIVVGARVSDFRAK